MVRICTASFVSHNESGCNILVINIVHLDFEIGICTFLKVFVRYH